ncbi:MAG TPA: Hsp20/alpha crystallin family protein [Dongiaceae bacterium]|nr:Hsp20/alpha crystallin family protein [Dongiaceae bacterium]
MNLQKLNPWNWFKHEERQTASQGVPVQRSGYERTSPVAGQNSGMFYPMQQLHQEIDRLFDGLLRNVGLPSWWDNGWPTMADPWSGGSQNSFRPSLSVSSDNGSYQVMVEVPGLGKDDLSIQVRDDALIIQGQKQEESNSQDRHFYRVERSYGTFQRTLALPEDANADEIEANLKDGVLTLVIPRRELPDNSGEAKKITIH